MIKNLFLLTLLSITIIYPSSDPALVARRNFVLISAPGSGKGTFSQHLVQKHRYTQICLGDIFRAEVAAQSELGKRIQPVMDRGDYVDEDITCALVAQRLGQILAKNETFIIDGFPRSEHSLKFLAEFIKKNNIAKKILFLQFHAQDETCVQRILHRQVCTSCASVFNSVSSKPFRPDICDTCGEQLSKRTADTPEIVKKRLVYFHQHVEPLVAQAEKSFITKKIDANRSLDALHAEYDQLAGEVRD